MISVNGLIIHMPAASHVLVVAGVALHYLVGRLEADVDDLSHGELLVVGLLAGDDWSVDGEGGSGYFEYGTRLV